MIIVDTNIFSEVLKPRPSSKVAAWLAAQARSSLFTTAVTQAEILYGIEIMPRGARRTQLSEAVERIFSLELVNHIVPFDEEAARVYPQVVAARRSAGKPISQFDAMIAAIARSHRASVATRNVDDFEHCGVRVINPWDG